MEAYVREILDKRTKPAPPRTPRSRSVSLVQGESLAPPERVIVRFDEHRELRELRRLRPPRPPDRWRRLHDEARAGLSHAGQEPRPQPPGHRARGVVIEREIVKERCRDVGVREEHGVQRAGGGVEWLDGVARAQALTQIRGGAENVRGAGGGPARP